VTAAAFPGPPPEGAPPRGPRWGRILGGIAILFFLAGPALVGVIATAVGSTAKERSNAIAEGRAPGTLRFRTEAKSYVVALSAKPDGIFDGLNRLKRSQKFRVRESDATQARCAIRQPDGSVEQIRGDHQTSSVVVGNRYASVGRFDGQAGTTTVACRFDPTRDMLGTVTEAPLMVHTASVLHTWMWGFLGALLLFVALGVLQILRGTVWRGGR